MSSLIKPSFGSLLISMNLIILFLSLKKSKQNCFFSNTFFLLPISVYVWGDALIISLFWILAGIFLFFINWINWLKLIIIFFTLRSFFEVIYWLNAQAVGKKYKAPLFKNVKWLNAEQSAILYQLVHFVIVVFGLWGLLSI